MESAINNKNSRLLRSLALICLTMLGPLACTGLSNERQSFQSNGMATPTVVKLERAIDNGTLIESNAVAAGFFLDANTIVTAAHFVEGEGSQGPIVARVLDQVVEAEVRAIERCLDIALLRPTAPLMGVRPAVPASHALEAGQPIRVSGFPLPQIILDEQSTLTGGIVSATDRSLNLDGAVRHGLIQFDAVVSQGGSGGPLMDTSSRVHGVVTLAASGDMGEWRGAAFAVPIGEVLQFLELVEQLQVEADSSHSASVVGVDCAQEIE